MRLIMYAIGSRGDVLPYLALGRELQKRGHTVSLCAFSDFKKEIIDAGFSYHTMGEDSRQFISKLISGPTGVLFLLRIAKKLRQFSNPLLQDIENAAHGADAIISNYFADLFQTMAEYLHLPYIQTQYFPMDYTAEIPITAAPFRKMGRCWNRFTYHVAYGMITAIEKHYLDPWRKTKGMRPIHFQTSRNYHINGHMIPIIYAIPEVILPRPAEWPDNIYMTGFWHDEEPYHPDESLLAFLNNGPPPLYIGFGSVTQKESDRILDITLEALRLCGLRAVVNIGLTDIPILQNELIFPLRYVSHEWLFPKMCAIVHHGGAGTVSAALRAGKPMLIIPFGADQSFWAERSESLHLGPDSIPAKKLTTKNFAKALKELTNNPSYAGQAEQIKKQLQNTHPTKDAADIIECEIANWKSSAER